MGLVKVLLNTGITHFELSRKKTKPRSINISDGCNNHHSRKVILMFVFRQHQQTVIVSAIKYEPENYYT